MISPISSAGEVFRQNLSNWFSEECDVDDADDDVNDDSEPGLESQELESGMKSVFNIPKELVKGKTWNCSIFF